MAWRTILALSITTAAVAVGCTVTSSTGADGGTGAETSTGGSSGTDAGGSATGGAETGGGGSSTGGMATGGTGGECTIDNASTDACAGCINSKCKDEYCACTGTCASEYGCIANCLQAGFTGADGGSMDLATCASACMSADGGGTVAPETDDLVGCIDAKGDSGTEACSTECFGFALNP